MEEIWKDLYFIENDIEYDYRGLYQVSNFGRVKSLWFDKEKILKQTQKENGYLCVNLHMNKKQKTFLIHRLVANMFISNPESKPEINHLDEDKTNNKFDNLEWCTREYNTNYGTHNKRVAKTLSHKVVGYSLTETKVIILQSAEQGKKIGFSSECISRCCKGKQKTHKGYTWKYLD